MWFEKVGGKTRIARSVYLSDEEKDELMKEAKHLELILKKTKLTLSDMIRVRCFYINRFYKLKGGKK